jgi:hypothetical protein
MVARRLCASAFADPEEHRRKHPNPGDCYANLSAKDFRANGLGKQDASLLHYRVVEKASPRLAVHEIHWANLARDFHRPSIFRFFFSSALSALNISEEPYWKRLAYAFTIFTLSSFLWIFSKGLKIISLNKLSLSTAYERFLGDVELYARGDIDDLEYTWGGHDHVYHHVNRRFDTHLSRIAEQFDEIYIVAHSLGSVLTVNRMMNAMLQDTDDRKEWLEKVKLLITMGSPVDKFESLFPTTLIPTFIPRPVPSRTAIAWYNITAFWDPVGGKIDKLFETDEKHPEGEVFWLEKYLLEKPHEIIFYGKTPDRKPRTFIRAILSVAAKLKPYIIGLAHVTYWEDRELWSHIYNWVQQPMDTRRTEPHPILGGNKEGEARRKLESLPFVVVILSFLVSFALALLSDDHMIGAFGYQLPIIKIFFGFLSLVFFLLLILQFLHYKAMKGQFAEK